MTNQKLVTYIPLNLEGEPKTLPQELNLTILEKSGNYVIHKDLVRQKVLRRQGTLSTKTRSEIRGGGRKPWKQKGTGRARAGSNRSPLWRGGGVIFGPKPKQSVTYKLNKKERRLALQTLLYNKKNKITLLDDLEIEFDTPKTKKFLAICEACNLDINENLLIVVSKKTSALKLATRNLDNTKLIQASNLNTFNLMKAKQVVITSKALNDIKETFCE